MNVVETSSAVSVEPEGRASAAVVWLHGLGADGYDFLPIVSQLELPAELAVRFVFPHAPVRPVTLNGGAAMRAWYDLLGLDRAAQQDVAGLRASTQLMNGLIDTQVAAGVARERIVVAGFSQGGALALHVGLRQRNALGGIMALSAYLPLAAQLEQELTPAGHSTQVLMCHGSHDPVLALGMGSQACTQLRALGVSVSWHEYPMAHEVCAAEIQEISGWLRARCAASAPGGSAP